jgi:hypothetical protein
MIAGRDMKLIFAGLMAFTAALVVVGNASAQTMIDRVQRRGGIDTGQITAVTPLGGRPPPWQRSVTVTLAAGMMPLALPPSTAQLCPVG